MSRFVKTFRFVTCARISQQRLPREISRLGNKPRRYAELLIALANAGNRESRIALRAFRQVVRHTADQPVYTVLKNVNRQEVCPVNLHTNARWVSDAAASLALQQLLWVWQANKNPKNYLFGDWAAALPDFDVDSAERWWRLARLLLIPFYYQPKQIEEMASLLGIPKAKKREVLRRIRDRFREFARKKF